MQSPESIKNTEHKPVLLVQAVEAVLGDPQGHYVDATFGRGGHTRLLLSRLAPQARVSVFDKDPQAIAVAQRLAQEDPRVQVVHASFTDLAHFPACSIAGILMDLGVSSSQLDCAERGFSFQLDGPLDMRMNNSSGHTVAQWLQNAPLQQIREVIHEYGQERYALPIAKAIVAHRQSHGCIVSTARLAQVVAAAVKTRQPRKNPATRTFQAFRVFINAELEDLRQALKASLRVLAVRGRLVVIAFHSLEDRIVKQFIAQNARQTVDRRAPFAPVQALPLRALGKTRASAAEVQANPRARSAMMRVAQRTEAALQNSCLGQGARA